MSEARASSDEHWCWCCSAKVNCSEDPDTRELVCAQCGNTFVEIYDPNNEEHHPESFIPPTMPSPRASPASSPSAAAAAATNPPSVSASSHAAASAGTTNPSPASTLHAPPHFAFLSPSLPGPAQVQSVPHTPATVAPVRAAGGAAPAGTAVRVPRSLIAGSLQNVLQHLIRSIHGGVAHPMGVGLGAGANNIHGDIGNYAFGNLQNIMNDLMERNPTSHKNPTPSNVIKALPRIKVKAKEEHPEGCSVCQDDFNAGDSLVLLPCGHKFHDACIKPWLVENNSCPVCRKPLRSSGATASGANSGSSSGSAAAASASGST